MPIPKKKVLSKVFGHKPEPALVRIPANYRDNNMLIGIEIECENTREAVRVFLNKPNSWKMVEDGSLRNGMEFICNKPYNGDELAGAIHQFFELTANTGIVANARTSCHIHVDMRDVEMEEVRGMIMVYQAAEQAFWSTTHAQRRWTGYCLPLMESQGQIVAVMMRDEFSDMEVDRLMKEVSKYSAFNVISMKAHGSFEFRHFHNPVDEAELNKWVNFCQAVKIVGKQLAVTANAAGQSVFEWVSDEPSRVVELVMADETLAVLCQPVPREAMTGAIEHLLAVCEAVALAQPPVPRAQPAHVAQIMGRMNGQVPRFKMPGVAAIQRYISWQELRPIEQDLCAKVYYNVVERGLIDDAGVAQQFYDALVMKFNFPSCSNYVGIRELAQEYMPNVDTDELIYRIGKAGWLILSARQRAPEGEWATLTAQVEHLSNIFDRQLRDGDYNAAPAGFKAPAPGAFLDDPGPPNRFDADLEAMNQIIANHKAQQARMREAARVEFMRGYGVAAEDPIRPMPARLMVNAHPYDDGLDPV